MFPTGPRTLRSRTARAPRHPPQPSWRTKGILSGSGSGPSPAAIPPLACTALTAKLSWMVCSARCRSMSGCTSPSPHSSPTPTTLPGRPGGVSFPILASPRSTAWRLPLANRWISATPPRAPGASADWQVVLPDGTALGDVRYTLQTDRGDLLYVQSRGIRHGTAEVLARLGRGEDVDASEYTFRTATQIETGTPDLDWLNKGVFISVGGRQAGRVIYETYLVA